MARLGELLVAAGELTTNEIEQALRAQIMWGGRLGTNLVELGFIDLDKLATALGKQHRLPAALGRHFDKSDRAVQAKLSADLAERFSCIPLLYAGAGRSQLIVASIEPLSTKAVAIIADELGVDPKSITQSIAGELRIRYHLERVYKIARGTRFLRPKGKTVPQFPIFEIDPLAFEDSQVDVPTIAMPTLVAEDLVESAELVEEITRESSSETDLAIEEARGELRARLEANAAAKAKTETLSSQESTLSMQPMFDDDDIQELEALAMLDEDIAAIPEEVEPEGSSGRERRRYVQTLDATPRTIAAEAEADHQASLGRIAIKKLQIAASAAVDEPPTGKGLTLGEATRAIRRSTDRDRVAELVSETLFRFMLSCDAALLLVVRGDAAMGWKGFSRAGASIPEIAVPLDQPGMIPRVIDRCQTARSPSSDLGPIDQLLLVSLGAQSGDLVVVPVSIANQVMCVIAMATQHGAQSATAESIAAAAGAAFARLMRNASR